MPHYDEGKYRIRIVSQTLAEGGQKKDGGDKAPSLVFGIMPIGWYEKGELQDLDDDFERTIFLPITEATLGTTDKPGWVLQTLQWLGFTGASFALLDPASDDHQSFVGKEMDALCKHESYQGKDREKWSFLRGGGDGFKAKQASSKEVRGLDAKFAKLLKTLQGTPSKTPAPRPEEQPEDALQRQADERANDAPSEPEKKPRKSRGRKAVQATAGDSDVPADDIPF